MQCFPLNTVVVIHIDTSSCAKSRQIVDSICKVPQHGGGYNAILNYPSIEESRSSEW